MDNQITNFEALMALPDYSLLTTPAGRLTERVVRPIGGVPRNGLLVGMEGRVLERADEFTEADFPLTVTYLPKKKGV